MRPLSEIVATTLVEVVRLGLFAYAIHSGRTFLLRWLDTRSGLPLFSTSRLTREQAVDAARTYGITNDEVQPLAKAA